MAARKSMRWYSLLNQTRFAATAECIFLDVDPFGAKPVVFFGDKADLPAQSEDDIMRAQGQMPLLP